MGRHAERRADRAAAAGPGRANAGSRSREAASRARGGVDHEPARCASRGYARHVRAIPELLSRIAPGAPRDHARRARAGRESRHCTGQAREAVPDHARCDRCRSYRRTISHARSEARRLRQELSGRRRRLLAERQRAVGVGDQQRCAPYIRGVPTGPASPVVVAVTTSGNTLCAGITYRTAAAGPDDILDLQAHIKGRIRALK